MKNFLAALFLALSTQSFAKEDIVLKFKNQKDKSSVAALIQKNKEEIKAQGEKFILIKHELMNPESKSPLTAELLRLKKANIITDVLEDKPVYPQSQIQLDGVSCSNPPVETLNQELDKLTKVTSKLNESCTLSIKCKDSSVSWAPMAMGADFAEEIVNSEIAKSKNPNVKSKTAVIDTGFDQKHQTTGLSSSIKVEAANSSISGLEHDDGGHGTPVASMISGKHTGVTKNVDLTMFKLTNERKESSTDSRIAEAIEKACKQNNDVVNVSWGSTLEEQSEVNSKAQLWYEVAKRQGCLVIQSAGNSGVRKKSGTRDNDLEDPHLTVEALDIFQEFAKFSTVGMVSAPGQKVFSLLSEESKYSESTNKTMCAIDQNQHGKISGTSFSAPAVAGVASQIVATLRAKGMIPKDPVQKVKLIKSILYAAQGYPEKRNGINAYAAVLIASKVSENLFDSSIEELKQIAKDESRKRCNQPLEKCEDQLQCSDKKSCVQNLRKRSFLCPVSGDELEALVVGLDSLKEKEMVMGLLSQIPEKELMTNTKYKDIYSTDFFESMFKDSSAEDIQYLLKKPVFKKNPNWKKWVKNFVDESLDPVARVSLFQDEDVSRMPEWESWVKTTIPKTKLSKELIDLLEKPEALKLVDLNDIAKKVFESKEKELKIYFLSSQSAQNHPDWQNWMEKFMAEANDGSAVADLLSDRDILKNEKWRSLLSKAWSSNYLRSFDKGTLVVNKDVQKRADWPELVDMLFREKGEFLRQSYVLRDEAVKKLPKWERYLEKVVAENPDDYLLIDPKVKKHPEWNSWVEKYIADPKNSSTVFLADEAIASNTQYPRWVELKLNSAKDNFDLINLLKNKKIQNQPIWEKKIKEVFERPGDSFSKMSLLETESIQKTALWDELLKKYMDSDSEYKESLLQEKKVLEKAEWGKWASQTVKDSKEPLSIKELLKNELVHNKPEWKGLVHVFMQVKEAEDHQADFLTSVNIMRRKEWGEFALDFVKNAENEQAIVGFLRNEYVLATKDWKKLANAYLEKASDDYYKNLLLSSDNIAEKFK